MSTKQLQASLSVIIPACVRAGSTVAMYKEYKDFLSTFVSNLQFIIVVSIRTQKLIGAELEQMSENDPNLSLLVMSRDFGEATAIKAGSSQATGEFILILPPYKQVDTTAIPKLFDFVDDYDIVLAKRWPRVDSQSNQVQSKLFNYLLRKFSKQSYSDIGCSVRLMRATVMQELNIYGDQNRFMPLFAHEIGFRCKEVEIPQAIMDSKTRIHNPGTYTRRLLDLLTVVFLTKFNKKPLRFFGLIGSASILTGMLGLFYLAFERLVLSVPLADRPLLVLFSLFFVLGLQLLAIGLVGEIVVFTHAGKNKEYRIREVINFPDAGGASKE